MQVVTFDEEITLADLKPFTDYLIALLAGNVHTGDVTGVELVRVKCTTQPNGRQPYMYHIVTCC